MKKYFSGITLKAAVIGSAGLVLGTTAVRAQEMTGSTQAQDAAPVQAQDMKENTPSSTQEQGLYLNASAGINFASDLSDDLGLNTRVALEPGVRVDLCVGIQCRLSKHFSLAPELETGVLYNSFGNGNGLNEGNPVNTTGGGSLIQVPVLINWIANYKITSRWRVYAGVGLGIAYTDATTSNSALNTLEGEYGTFVFDVKAGVQYKLGPGYLGVDYKYLYSTGNFAINPIDNNSVEASYTINF